MLVSEMREKALEDLREELTALKKAQFNMRFQASGGQLEDTSKVRATRRDIARVMTVINEKARAAAGTDATA